MTVERYAAVTARCLTEDLAVAVPHPEEMQRAALDEPLIRELCRLAPETPKGQKPIESLHERGIRAFRLRAGEWRGASLHLARTSTFSAVWLVAAGFRKADSPDQDAYEHFGALADAGLLLPTEEDWMDVAVERLIWFTLPQAAKEVLESIEAAIATPEVPIRHRSPVSNVEAVAQVVAGPDGVVDLLVAFYHASAASEMGNRDVHALILTAIAEHFGFETTEWRAAWSVGLDQTAVGMYNAIFDYPGDQ